MALVLFISFGNHQLADQPPFDDKYVEAITGFLAPSFLACFSNFILQCDISDEINRAKRSILFLFPGFPYSIIY